MNRFEEIIDFWFEGVDDQTTIDKSQSPFNKWFRQSKAFDEEIQSRFETDLLLAAEGKYASWLEAPQGCLASILLYDQFSRNIYRDSKQKYKYDPLALTLTQQGIESSLDKELSLIHRVFFYMPLMHAEDFSVQELSIQCFRNLTAECKVVNPSNVSYYEYHLKYALKFHDTIKQAGHFSHRL